MNIGWIYLLSAIALETAGTTCMKLSAGFTKLFPSILVFIFYVSSLIVFTVALKSINLSIAYAVWSGLGTALVAILGFVIFKETVSPLKIVSLSWIVLGVIGLNVSFKPY